jgi:hypothetical protein
MGSRLPNTLLHPQGDSLNVNVKNSFFLFDKQMDSSPFTFH